MRRMIVLLTALGLILVSATPVSTKATTVVYADSAFQHEWQTGEVYATNYYGPLATAHDGQREPYKESSGGQRIVQYFDKGRMELASNSTVTAGLLTVELKTGKIQTGDNAFEQRVPAKVNLAGDPGNGGPTYADLTQLPEKVQNLSTTSNYYEYANGTFHAQSVAQQDLFRAASFTYMGDSGGRYGNYVWQPFTVFMMNLPAGVLGFPIAPMFTTSVNIGGKSQFVAVQAFERRVLTWNAGELGVTRPFVEFGNIGQHYFRWRYDGMPSAVSNDLTGLMHSPPAASMTNYSAFAQRWGHHGYQLVVAADGFAHEDYRTYSDCYMSPTPATPCEDPYVSYAAHTTIQLTSINGTTARGKIITTNYSRQEAVGTSVSLTLKQYDMAELTVGTGNALTLCGPDYSKQAPADVIHSSPCGA